MADQEKVIKGLECCLTLDSPCGDCPYYSYKDIQELDCERNLRHDTLALLKEQKKDRLEIAHEMVSNSILMYQGKELVRCNECKHSEKTPTFKYDLEEIKKKLPKGVLIIEPGPDVTWCNKHLTSHNDNWFCADGERKKLEGEA